MAKLRLLTFLALYALKSGESCTLSNIYQLEIPPGYDPRVPHRPNISEPARVNFRFEIAKIQGVDDVEGIVNINLFVFVKWKDERLLADWNCTGVADVSLLDGKIWKPGTKHSAFSWEFSQ